MYHNSAEFYYDEAARSTSLTLYRTRAVSMFVPLPDCAFASSEAHGGFEHILLPIGKSPCNSMPIRQARSPAFACASGRELSRPANAPGPSWSIPQQSAAQPSLGVAGLSSHGGDGDA